MPLLGGGRIPLAFIGLGLACWLAASGWLLVRPDLLLVAHFQPAVVALAHLWLPGFLLSVCLGALYQLLPVVLGTPLRAPDAIVCSHLALHAGGVAGLVAAFASGRYALAGAAGLAITGGVALLVVTTWRTFLGSPRRDAVAWCGPLAVTWLGVTVLSGVLLAVNRSAPFLPVSVLELLRAHAHAGWAGFFLTLLQGFTFQLVPMFTLGQARRPRCIAGGLAAAQAGLLLLVLGLAFPIAGLAPAGIAALLGGILLSGVALRATLQSRRRRVLEPGLRAFVAGVIVLIGAAVLGGALRVLPLDEARALALAGGYGILVIAGALSLTVLGMLCKIIPFLVWMRAYGPRVGRAPVPVATTLASRPLEQAWLLAQVAGLILVFLGVALANQSLATAGSIALAGAAACYLGNAVRVLRHLWPAAVAAPQPRPILS